MYFIGIFPPLKNDSNFVRCFCNITSWQIATWCKLKYFWGNDVTFGIFYKILQSTSRREKKERIIRKTKTSKS